MIINTEWGAFGEQGGLENIITEADKVVDKESPNEGKQLYEKMISGMYLGEIVRQNIRMLVEHKVLFDGKLPEQLSRKHSFTSRMVSFCEKDKTNQSLKETISKKLSITLTDEEAAIIRLLCERVSTRGAKLVAAGLIAILERQGE